MPVTDARKKPDREPLLIDLALQGGGFHDAFAWGVLDRLLEEPHLRIGAISGTSAGAMNAAVLADGWAEARARGARPALDAYWERAATAVALSPLQRTPMDRMLGRWSLDFSPVYMIDLGSSSKMIGSADAARERATCSRRILDEHLDDIGKRSTADQFLSEC